MPKPRALPNGNCLFNAFSLLLVDAYLEGKLKLLAQDHAFLQSMAQLFEASSTEPAVVADAVADCLKNAMTEDCINWGVLQQMLAPRLRKIVIAAIKKEQVVKAFYVTRLGVFLDQSIDHSTATAIVVPEEFHEMTTLRAKVEALKADLVLSEDDRKQRLKAWFFEGAAQGWDDYLDGPGGISHNRVYLSILETGHVLCHLFKIQITYYYPQGNQKAPTAVPITGIVPEQANLLEFPIQFHHVHCEPIYDVMRYVEQCMAEPPLKPIARQTPEPASEEPISLIDEIIVEYSSLMAHWQAVHRDLRPKQYLDHYGISLQQVQHMEPTLYMMAWSEDWWLPKAVDGLTAKYKQFRLKHRKASPAEDGASAGEDQSAKGGPAKPKLPLRPGGTKKTT